MDDLILDDRCNQSRLPDHKQPALTAPTADIHFISHTKSSSFRLNTRTLVCFPPYDELPNTENRLTKLGPYSS
jgi:hypothetical protein